MPDVHNILKPRRDAGHVPVAGTGNPRASFASSATLSSESRPPASNAPQPAPGSSPAPRPTPASAPQTSKPAQPPTPAPPRPVPRRNSGAQPLPLSHPAQITPHPVPAPAPRRQSGPSTRLPQITQSPQSFQSPRGAPIRQSGPQPTVNPGAPQQAMIHRYPTVTPPSRVHPHVVPPPSPSPPPASQSGPRAAVPARQPVPRLGSGSQHPANAPLPTITKRPIGGDTAVLRTAEQKKTVREVQRPGVIRIHARTLVLCVCLAGGLANLNYRDPAILSCSTIQKEVNGSKVSSYVTEIRGRGWPLTQIQKVETSDPILAMEKFRNSTPGGMGGIGARNILACLALVLGTGLLCEFLTRRSEAGDDAASF